MTRVVVLTGVLVMALLTACGGGGGASGGGGDTGDSTGDTASEGAAADAGSEAAGGGAAGTPSDAAGGTQPAELPAFLSEFSRVCTTQVGFPGAASYNKEPGTHKIQLFEEFEEGGNWIETSRQLPKDWVVTQDADFEDNSELAAIELIGCLDIVSEKPNGTKCDFDSDGKTVTLELVDVNYELTVYEATTGTSLGKKKLQAKSTECPYFATFEEGDTTYNNEVDDPPLINAIKPFVVL